MKKNFFLLFFILFCKTNSQVVAVGDTTLCDSQQGDVGITLTATSFAVDLNDANIYVDDTYGGVIDMGFDFEVSKTALKSVNGDITAAISRALQATEDL